MSWWRGFADRVQHDAPIGRHTWFRVGGRARHLIHPRDAAELASVLCHVREKGAPWKVLGSGANVLVSDDGFDGVVVRLDGEEFRRIERNGSTLKVGAGVDLIPLARRCSEQGLAGLECMAGIPAGVGGAVRMNAGGRFGDFGGVVREIEVVTRDGELETRSHERIGFGYRRSSVGDAVVVSATLDLKKDDPAATRARFDECFEYKRASQPLAEKSAGCVFKNPDGLSAGALIDRAGLKGASYGGAQVSDRHANFIIARDGATASDVLHLIDMVRDRVRTAFGTELELEIDVWRPLRAGGGGWR